MPAFPPVHCDYWIKLDKESPALFDTDGALVVDHEFSVPAGACWNFNFRIDAGNTGMRFRRLGDPSPAKAITWNDSGDPPVSVHCDGATEADTLLTISVANPSDRSEALATSFTLHLFSPDGTVSRMALNVDPTIIQKPDEFKV